MTSSDPDNIPAGSSSRGRSGNRGMRRMLPVLLALVAIAATGALALYGMKAGSGNAGGQQNSEVVDGAPVPDHDMALAGADAGGRCAASVAQARALAPLVRGKMQNFALVSVPRPLPPLVFSGPDGRRLGLEDFRGKVLLINLWATWCAPCRHEMPALDRLQQQLGGPDFEVVAINIDARDTSRPRTFMKDVGVRHLALYVDSDTRSFQALRGVGRGFGLPSTLLVNAEGCELGFLAGPAEWDGPEAVALIRAAMAQGGIGVRRQLNGL